MKKENGIARLYIIVFTIIVIIIGAIVFALVLKNNNDKSNKEKQNVQLVEDTTEKGENKIANENNQNKIIVEPIVFTKEYLQSGNINGKVEYIDNKYGETLILSITGIADNNIDEVNFVSTKNRWYKTIDLTDYSTLEFYARNGKDGDIMICVDNTIIERIRYTDVPATWKKYTVDLSKYSGKHILSIAGGYADKTGSEDSNTQYCNIKLK